MLPPLTPWNNFWMLPDDNAVLQALRDFTELKGLIAIGRLRQLWARCQDDSLS